MANDNVEATFQPPPSSVTIAVTDALDYLDKVKDTFKDTPETYNQFLDIMKGFKNATLNTSEAIQRVSTLFKGHASLITGFNTFLPPGYHIESVKDDIMVCEKLVQLFLDAPELIEEFIATLPIPGKATNVGVEKTEHE